MHRKIFIALLAWAGAAGGAAAQQCAPVAEQNLTCGVPYDPAAGVPVATLSQISGDVMTSVDSGFTLVSEDQVSLLPGDRVIVADDGKATVTMGATCSSELPARTSLTILAEGGCVYYSTTPMTAAAVEEVLTSGSASGSAAAGTAAGGVAGGIGAGTVAAVGIGVVAVAAAVAAIAESQSSSDTPVVPISP
ncbi:hypothetical protein [Microbaculum marinum]|uniref:Uncharacterized protein n=1 Tax=Microbaculum marinum TaxID=1764581 RepID=A0AAW9RRC9_9HYPH